MKHSKTNKQTNKHLLITKYEMKPRLTFYRCL